MRKNLIPVYLLSFVNVIGFTILFPVIPQIIETLQGDITENAVINGMIASIYAVFQFIGSPILGNLSDRFGRKPILIITQSGTLISWIIMSISYFLSRDLFLTIAIAMWVIFIARIIDGITGGNVSVANAYLSDVTSRAERTKIFGFNGAFVGLGIIIGPAIGGYSAGTEFGYLGTTVLAAIISLVTLLSIIFFLPESLPEDKRQINKPKSFWNQINIVSKIREYKSNQIVFSTLLYRMFFSFAMVCYISVLSIDLTVRFGLDEVGIGNVMVVIGIIVMINQAFGLKKLSGIMRDRTILLISGIMMFIGLVLVSVISSIWIFMALTLLLNGGIAFSMPTFKAILTKHTDEKRQGEITGIEESIIALSNSIVPIFINSLYSSIQNYTFLIASALLLLGLIMYWYKIRLLK